MYMPLIVSSSQHLSHRRNFLKEQFTIFLENVEREDEFYFQDYYQ